MSLPIEPGCLARVVSAFPDNNGKVVRVYSEYIHERLPNGRCVNNRDRKILWCVSEEVIWRQVNTSKITGSFPIVSEEKLQRIDDDSRQITSWESMKDIWPPKEAIA